MAVDSNGLLNIANRSGILQFDGKNWDFIPTPAANLSLAIDKNQKVYAAGIDEFGYLGIENNNFQFISLN